MTTPSVPASIWVWAAVDPLLVLVAVYLGWRADQAGKVIIAALAALGLSLLFGMLLGLLGIPWIAPLSRDGPMLLPVRSIAALMWAGAGYGSARILERSR